VAFTALRQEWIIVQRPIEPFDGIRCGWQSDGIMLATCQTKFPERPGHKDDCGWRPLRQYSAQFRSPLRQLHFQRFSVPRMTRDRELVLCNKSVADTLIQNLCQERGFAEDLPPSHDMSSIRFVEKFRSRMSGYLRAGHTQYRPSPRFESITVARQRRTVSGRCYIAPYAKNSFKNNFRRSTI
jgi:hypothetical protein